MEAVVYLDTHIVVWLYMGEKDLFSSRAFKMIEDKQLIISPIVLLELEYLYEIKRLKVNADKIFKSLEKSIGLKVCDRNFHFVALEAVKQSWTRDPFDRLIVAQALTAKAALITKDVVIQKHYARSVW